MKSTCYHCHTEHPEGHYERVVHNKTPLYGPWSGWRMAGQYLVSPDRARITPERLRGILWRESLYRPRKYCTGRPPGGLVIPAREIFAGQA